MRYLLLLFSFSFLLPLPAQEKDPKETPTIATKTAGLERTDGFYPYYYAPEEGKLYLLLERTNEDFLYVNSLAAGLGSNDIGLDRNQLGNTRVVCFKRVGPKVLLQQRNLDYRKRPSNYVLFRSCAAAH